MTSESEAIISLAGKCRTRLEIMIGSVFTQLRNIQDRSKSSYSCHSGETTFRCLEDLAPRSLLLPAKRPPDHVLGPPLHRVVVSLRRAAGSGTGPLYKVLQTF